MVENPACSAQDMGWIPDREDTMCRRATEPAGLNHPGTRCRAHATMRESVPLPRLSTTKSINTYVFKRPLKTYVLRRKLSKCRGTTSVKLKENKVSHVMLSSRVVTLLNGKALLKAVCVSVYAQVAGAYSPG